MRYIDAFNHFNPKRYHEQVLESPLGQKDLGKRIRGIPALWDLEQRLKVVDQFSDYTQVLSLGMPMVDRLWGPDK
jgi:aminocarboxymuconate-semialdehyde decarboxylase